MQLPLLNWDETTQRLLSERLREPTELLDMRLSASKSLPSVRWPSAIQESWRRTDPGTIGTRKFKLWDPSTPSEPIPEDEISPACCSWLHLHNCIPRTSVIVNEHHNYLGLFGALEMGYNSDGKIKNLMLEIPDDDDSPAVGLTNTAYHQGGFYVNIPPFTVNNRPIWIRHSVNTPDAALLPLNVIRLGGGSEATLMVESQARTETESWFSQRTIVEVRPGGRLNLVIVNHSTPATRFYDHLQLKLGKDATCRVTWADMTGGWAVVRRETTLSEPGSEAIFKGVHIGTNNSHLDLRTLQDHPAPHTHSDLLYKTAMFDAADSVYQGLIIVRPTAAGANAYQLNRNLLMSQDSRADSIPKLEIEVDDVRCTHGASAGKVDPEALFYLMSRGMPLDMATQLLIEGFLGEVSDYLPDGTIKEYWRGMVFDASHEALNKL